MSVVHFSSARGRAILDAIESAPLPPTVGEFSTRAQALLQTFAAELGVSAQDALDTARGRQAASIAEARRIAAIVTEARRAGD
jgi:hypothetical protein